MTTPESPRTTAPERERPNDSLPLRAANFLGDTIDALDTLARRYDDGPRADVRAEDSDNVRTRLVAKRAKRKRDRHAKTKVAFLRYSYYDAVFRFFVERVLDAEYVDLGEPTKVTLELGAMHSNDFVCAPFKHILGEPTCSCSSRARAVWATTANSRSRSCATWATSSKCSTSPKSQAAR